MSEVPFDVTASIADDTAVIAVAGEVDIYSAPHIHEELQALIAKGVRHVTVDMSNIEFIDSSGLNTILRVRALCEEHMCDFALTPGERPIQRLFEVTRLIDRLPFRRTRHVKHSEERAERSPATPAEGDG